MTKINKNLIFSWAKLIFVVVMAIGFQSHILEASGRVPNLPNEDDMTDEDAREILWLARAVFSESKKENEMRLIAEVIRNRVEANHLGATSFEEVVRKPHQFSGLNSNDAQYRLNTSLDYDDADEAHESWANALHVAERVYFDKYFTHALPDDVLYFYSPRSMHGEPSWADGMNEVLIINNVEGAEARFIFLADNK